MDALLLALLLGLALDQGDRSQRLARRLGEEAGRAAILAVCLIVIAGAVIAALLGLALLPHLPGRAGLLFFALALVLGASGLLIPMREPEPTAQDSARRSVLLGQLLWHRLADRSAFLQIGVVALTGNGWATALGGALGGLVALMPPLLAGSRYEEALPFGQIRLLLGALLLLAGLGCGLSAFGLL